MDNTHTRPFSWSIFGGFTYVVLEGSGADVYIQALFSDAKEKCQ